MSQIMIKMTVYVLLAAGGMLVCDGMWLRVKAMLAQRLLISAWEETVRTGISVKPWPWADSWTVARLQVERLGIDRVVLEGNSGEVLAFGPGHLPGSVSPGEHGNCVLAGNRDTTFTFLKELREGDIVTLEAVDGKCYKFEVTAAKVSEDGELYLERSDSSWLTLISSHPIETVRAATDHRDVVFARREVLLES